MPGSARLALLGAAIAAVFSATGCLPEEGLGPQRRRLIVEGVLDLGNFTHVISVRRNHGAGGTDGEPFATVTVTDTTGIEFRAVADTNALGVRIPGRYRITTRNELHPGWLYHLLVVTAAGDTVTGQTRIPQAVVGETDTTPRPFSRRTDSILLKWPPNPSGERHWVHFHSQDPFPNVVTHDIEWSFFADTVVLLRGLGRTPFDDPLFTRHHDVTILVAAVDSNYVEYYRTRVDPFAGPPPPRLRGAVGVFGSIVPILGRRYRVN